MLLLFPCPGITPAPACPASCRPTSSPPAWSGSAVAAPCRRSSRSTTTPSVVIRHSAHSFTLQVGPSEEIVTVSRLKACTAADAVPGSPRRRGRPPGKRPGGSAAAKQVIFAHPLASMPSPTAPPRNRFPTQRGGFCTPGTGGAITVSTAAESAMPVDTAA
jgi:hypothetical protein